MRKKIKRFETIMWMIIKLMLYVTLMLVFMLVMSVNNPTLLILCRTSGITMSTFAIVGLLFVTIYGKYDVGRRKSKPIIYSMFLAVGFTDVITYLQLMVMNTITEVSEFKLGSLGWLCLTVVIQLMIIILFTYGGNALFFKIHAPEKCHIITSSQESLNQILRGILRYPKQYNIVAIHDYRDKDLISKLNDAETVFLYDVPTKRRSEVVRYCYKKRKNIYLNPEIEDIVEMSSEYYMLDDISMVNYNIRGLTMEQRIIKRCMDIGLSLLMIIATSPIWIVSAIAIKLYDGGSIFFKQDRATIHGNVFQVYKFRTMKMNVENRSVTDNDDRITKPGHILRKIRMDELPQLLNILNGDMSFVGPRPEMLENVTSYTEEFPEFRYRLRVKAGLTGYAQIAGKYNTTPKDKLMMDLMYIENYSVFRDIQLLFQTAIVFLKSDSTEAFHNGAGQGKYIFKEAEEKIEELL